MSGYSPDVTFAAGAPLDVTKLNQLQRNIVSVFEENKTNINTSNATIGDLEKTVRVFPIIEVGQIDLNLPAGGCAQETVTFDNQNFSKDQPTRIVASVSSDIKPDYGVVVRAKMIGQFQARLEACTSSKTGLAVTVDYIAIQMKQS